MGHGVLERGAILEIGLERGAQKKKWVGARSADFFPILEIFSKFSIHSYWCYFREILLLLLRSGCTLYFEAIRMHLLTQFSFWLYRELSISYQNGLLLISGKDPIENALIFF